MTRTLLALLLGALFLPVAKAQTFDPASLDALFSGAPKVEVNLTGPLLQMAAMGSEGDPDTAAMLSGLRSIVVRVYDMSDAVDGLDDRLTAFGRGLEGDGWQTLVRVRPTEDDADDVRIYVRGSDDASAPFDGMAVMSLDGASGEASFVFIDGPIDPENIGRLGGRFGGIEDPEEAAEEASQEADDAQAEADEARAEADRAREEADRAREEADRARKEAERNRPDR